MPNRIIYRVTGTIINGKEKDNNTFFFFFFLHLVLNSLINDHKEINYQLNKNPRDQIENCANWTHKFFLHIVLTLGNTEVEVCNDLSLSPIHKHESICTAQR